MKVDGKRLPRRGAILVLVAAAVMATPSWRHAIAEPAAPATASTEPEPWCHRDQDLACTLVRETPGGVWVWTERFRPIESGTGSWTLAVGAGPIASVALVPHVVVAAPLSTPNGAPILE